MPILQMKQGQGESVGMYRTPATIRARQATTLHKCAAIRKHALSSRRRGKSPLRLCDGLPFYQSKKRSAAMQSCAADPGRACWHPAHYTRRCRR